MLCYFINLQGRKKEADYPAIGIGKRQSSLNCIQIVGSDFPAWRQGALAGVGRAAPADLFVLDEFAEGAAGKQRCPMFVQQQKAHPQVQRQSVDLPVATLHHYLVEAEDGPFESPDRGILWRERDCP